MSDELGGTTGGATGGLGPQGGSSGGTVAGGAGGAGAGVTVNGGASALVRMVRGTLPEHGHVSPSTGGEIDYLRTAWGTAHTDPLAEPDPHVQYAEDVDLAALAGDVYTKAEADARYVPAPLAVDDLPPELLTESEGDAAYATLAHTHPSEVVGDWYYAPSTNVSVDPGTGNFRANTTPLTAATTLAASRTTNDGYQVTVFDYLQTDDVIYLQDKNDNARWVRFRVSSTPTRTATWSTVPVALITSSGTAISTAQLCAAIFTVGAGGGGGGAGGVIGTDALWDARGDLAGGTGPNTAARLAVGSDGQFLTASSGTATGLAWAADPTTAHAALPNAHHAQAHDHTAADGSGALSNEEHDGYSQYANLTSDPATPATNRIRVYAKDNGSGVATLYYISESGQVYEIPTLTSGGGGGSGAPSNASYVTLSAENKLSAETALGTGVIMAGTAAARPAASVAGRLYLATDTGTVTRDSGSTWAAFAQASPKTYVQEAEPASPATGDLWVW